MKKHYKTKVFISFKIEKFGKNKLFKKSFSIISKKLLEINEIKKIINNSKIEKVAFNCLNDDKESKLFNICFVKSLKVNFFEIDKINISEFLEVEKNYPLSESTFYNCKCGKCKPDNLSFNPSWLSKKSIIIL